MIMSDTLHYRPDGTVSGVTRVVREEYQTPSGRLVTEDVSSSVTIGEVTALLDRQYASSDARNKALETQIVTERETAAADKEDALRAAAEANIAALTEKDRAHAAELSRKDEVIAQKDEALSIKERELAAASASAELEAVKS
jgi:hypothetical protein